MSYLGKIFEFLAIIKAYLDGVFEVVQVSPTWEQIKIIVEHEFVFALYE